LIVWVGYKKISCGTQGDGIKIGTHSRQVERNWWKQALISSILVYCHGWEMKCLERMGLQGDSIVFRRNVEWHENGQKRSWLSAFWVQFSSCEKILQCSWKGPFFVFHVVLLPQKVVCSIPDIIGFLSWPNRPSCTMALESTQPLTEISTRNLPEG
jgi:hypothetical protein